MEVRWPLFGYWPRRLIREGCIEMKRSCEEKEREGGQVYPTLPLI